ncbi:PREDICTED: uncharacterized protein LOC105362405 [Ceratosolen solmsi marchali]|uniref:Uncharacterized protein LOC105362405 n=1 Tax=Ceratosolen solmsi marchali TaxID=326594 RepID=A0AAJ6YHG9_9HYME|nr:PREDICTED: uncharacterized protein LOC105362405 [Ceratosolen solmsi marchali]
MRKECLRRVGYPRDQLLAYHDNADDDYVVGEYDAGQKLSSGLIQPELVNLESNVPTHLLGHHLGPLPNRRHSRQKIHHITKAKSRKRKKKRSNMTLPAENINSVVSNNEKQPIKVISNEPRRHATLSIILCLVIVTIFSLLFLYLHKRSQKQSSCDPFFCPSDTERPRSSFTETDKCTCCTDSPINGCTGIETSCTTTSREMIRSALKNQQPTSRQIFKKSRFKFTRKTRKKPTPPRKSCRFNEPDFNDLRRRIVCVLRNDCANCKYCRCNGSDDRPKRRRFGLFSRKKKILCNDPRCDEYKMKHIFDICNEINRNRNSTTNRERKSALK